MLGLANGLEAGRAAEAVAAGFFAGAAAAAGLVAIAIAALVSRRVRSIRYPSLASASSPESARFARLNARNCAKNLQTAERRSGSVPRRGPAAALFGGFGRLFEPFRGLAVPHVGIETAKV